MFVAALGAAFVVVGSASAQPAAYRSCPSVRDHNQLVRHALTFTHAGGDYRASSVPRNRLYRIGGMRACMKRVDRAKYRLMRGAWAKRRTVWAFHARIDRLTPYGEWAVPSYIVGRESGYSYRAYNPPPGGCSGNGCIGAYQIDADWFSRGCAGMGDPWSPAAQHQCAAYILRVQGIHAWATA